MPELFAEMGQAYQQPGARPIPTDWPKQNPVSWADTPDPATGMTPRQLGQGVIGAGKEIPQLVQAGLPQGDVVGQTQNPMANTAIGRVLNRYLFDPMTIRGPAQQTGARMMDVLSLLHGMNPPTMGEAVPRVPRFEEELPLEPHDAWWDALQKYGPRTEFLKGQSDDARRMAQWEQARLNRLRRGGPKAERLMADRISNAEEVWRRASSPQIGYEALGTEREPAGVIGEETPQEKADKYLKESKRTLPPTEQEIKERHQQMLLRGDVPLGYASDPYRIVTGLLSEKPYHVYSNFDGGYLGGFSRPEEAEAYIKRIMPVPPESTIRGGEEGPYPPGSIGAEAQRPLTYEDWKKIALTRQLTPEELEQIDKLPLTNEQKIKAWEEYKTESERIGNELRAATGGKPFEIVDPDTGKQYPNFSEWMKENPGKDWRSAILPLLPSGQPMSMEERLKSLISDLARQQPTPEQMEAFQKWMNEYDAATRDVIPPREIQSWQWPYDISPVSRDHRGLMRKPLLPWEGGDIVDFYTEGHGGGGGNGGNGH